MCEKPSKIVFAQLEQMTSGPSEALRTVTSLVRRIFSRRVAAAEKDYNRT